MSETYDWRVCGDPLHLRSLLRMGSRVFAPQVLAVLLARGEKLQDPRNAATLRWDGGKVSITDGPYTETKEQLGVLLILEAKNLNHAIQLMSKHPVVKAGPLEIRPVEDLTEIARDSEQRRSAAKKA